MKTARRVFLILTIVCGVIAVILDVAARMYAGAGGGREPFDDGFALGLSFSGSATRWVTLAAVILTAAAAILITAYILSRKKQRKAAEAAAGGQ